MSDVAPTPPQIAPKMHGSQVVPTADQAVVIYVVLVDAIVIFGMWNLPGFKLILNPLKLFTIGWHEICHSAVAILTGGRILSMSIDPADGGATFVEGGHHPSILSAGYIGSSILGGILVMASFDTLVSKIMSFFIGIGLLCPMVLVRDKLTIVLTVVYEALLIAFWFVDHASALRWYCLFMGVMSVLYVIWDLSDEKFFRKLNTSDCAQFHLLYDKISTHVWALIWMAWSVGVLTSFMLIGIAAFKLTTDQMRAQASTFLPT